jgi:outer membrane protein assembly factor BamB
MPSFDDFLKQLDTDKDGRLSRAEVNNSGFRDFFDIQDKNRSGFIEREEWEEGLKFNARGKNVVLAIKPGGRGDITGTHVLWSNERGAPYVSSPLFYEGRLYLAKDGGLLTAYEAATGKLLFEKQRLGVEGEYYASPVGAGGHIYLASLRGKVVVVKGGDKLKVAATNDLGASIAATPAVVESKLYIRSEKHLWAFGAK